MSQPTKKINIAEMRKKDAEEVRGVFRFFEVPGGTMSFSFRKYKDDPIKRYDLVDGKIYSVPRAVARHLVNDCWYPEFEFIKGEDGIQGMNYGVRKKIHRCGFESLEFMDEELMNQTQHVIEVTRTSVAT